MHDKIRYLCVSLCVAFPAVACDLPEKIVGETADPAEQEPEDEQPPEEEPAPPPEEEPAPPPEEEPAPDEPMDVDPPAEPTIVAPIAGTLAVDDTWLFVGVGNMPYRVLKTGGEVEPVVAEAAIEGTGSLELIAVDATHVYWSASGGPSFGFQVLRAPKVGGAPTLVTDVPGPNLATPYGIVVDDAYVYVTLPDIYNTNDGFENFDGVVRRVPKEGGPALDLAQDYAFSVAVSDASVYWTRPRADGGGELVRADKDGGNPTVFSALPGLIYEVRVAGDRLYWTSYDAGQYQLHTAIEGEAPTLLYSESGDEFYTGAPAATADAVYWLRPGGAEFGGVLGVDLEGTVDELVTAPASAPYSGFWGTFGARIAADETAVYWAYEGGQGGSSRIFRVAR